jgi:hypothetical protein
MDSSSKGLSVTLRRASAGDVPSLVALEAASYPPDEAATSERLAYRVQAAPELFLVLLVE